MRRVLAAIMLSLLLLSLGGCAKYISSYKAVGFVHSNAGSSAFMNFHSFDGRMVFRLKSSGEGDIRYYAKFESGEATVFYDLYGNKTELFSMKGGEEREGHDGYVEAGTVYVIVETNGACKNGEFQFSVE